MAVMEKLVSDANNMSEAVARTVDNAASNVHKAFDKAADGLADATTSAAQALEEKAGQLKVAQARLAESCRTQVREQPITAIGIAVAAGFLLSWLLSRRTPAG